MELPNTGSFLMLNIYIYALGDEPEWASNSLNSESTFSCAN